MRYRLKLALRYLREQRGRTVLTTLSVVIGVMLIFGLNGLVPALEHSLTQGLLNASSPADLVVTSESRGVFDQALVRQAAGTPGVAAAAGWLVRSVALPPEMTLADGESTPLNALTVNGLVYDTATRVRPLILGAGRDLEPGEDDAILIAASIAQRAGLEVGDSLRLPAAEGTEDFKIVGVVEDKAAAASDDIYLDLPAAQTLLQVSEQINTIEIDVLDGVEPDAVAQELLSRLGQGFRLGAVDTGSQFTASLDIARPVFIIFGILVLAMAGFIIFNTFRTVVAERQRDIALLRAVGATRRDITGLVLAESLIQGFAGTILGLIAGYLFIQGLLAAMGRIWMQRVNFPLGEARFTWQDFLLAVALGVGVTLVGALLPAISAARISPVEALRPSMAQVTTQSPGHNFVRRLLPPLAIILVGLVGLLSGYLVLASLGLLLFLIALILLSPILVEPLSGLFGRLVAGLYAAEGYLAQANLVRQPGRAAVTVSAMMIGLAILLALTGLVTSVVTDVTGFIDQSLGSDFLLMPQSQVLSGGNVGAGPELASTLRHVPGIEAVTTLRAATAQANGQDVQVMSLDPETYPTVAGLNFTDGDPVRAYMALGQGRSLIANTIYAARNQIMLGDKLALETPEGTFSYQVAGIASDYLNAQVAAVFLSHHHLAADFNETADLLLMANMTPGVDEDEIGSRLATLAASYPALTLYGPGEYRQQILNQGYSRLAIFYVMLTFVVVPSLFALANTLGISVIERTREVGMLRAVGATRRQMRRLIVAESLLLAAIGILLGILAGLWLGYVLVEGLNVFGYPVNYAFPWSGVILAFVVGLIMALLAAYLPARSAAAMDIARALQYE